MDVVMALDAGTSGIRAVAFGPDLTPLAQAYREFTQYLPAPGRVEHDAAEIADVAVATLRDVAERMLASGHRVVALGITNQRETTVAFDRESGHLPHRALVWQDRRTSDQCASLRESDHAATIRATTGLEVDAYFSATKMRWFLDEGHLKALAAPSVCTVDTWLLWWLTGGVAGGVYATEPSNASRTMLMDLDTLEWDSHLTELFGISRSWLADIRPSTSTFGAISPEVVPELAGVPVTGILGDQQAALFGQACFEPGMIKATYGTGAFVLANLGARRPENVPGLVTTLGWDLGAFGDVTYALEGSSFVAGAAVQWLRDQLGLIGDASELAPLAAQVSDAAGAMFVPAFSGLGSPFWRSEVRGALMGLSRSVTKAHVARAILEAQVFQVRAMTEAFLTSGAPLTELRADGGMAVWDELLTLQASSSGLPVRRSDTLEATARGVASLAGLAIGVWHSLEDLAQYWRSTFSAAPTPDPALEQAYASWRRALEVL